MVSYNFKDQRDQDNIKDWEEMVKSMREDYFNTHGHYPKESKVEKRKVEKILEGIANKLITAREFSKRYLE